MALDKILIVGHLTGGKWCIQICIVCMMECEDGGCLIHYILTFGVIPISLVLLHIVARQLHGGFMVLPIIGFQILEKGFGEATFGSCERPVF